MTPPSPATPCRLFAPHTIFCYRLMPPPAPAVANASADEIIR
jgi:hypothetical protein